MQPRNHERKLYFCGEYNPQSAYALHVVSGFSRTTTVRLKADTTYKRKML